MENVLASVFLHCSPIQASLARSRSLQGLFRYGFNKDQDLWKPPEKETYLGENSAELESTTLLVPLPLRKSRKGHILLVKTADYWSIKSQISRNSSLEKLVP